MLVVAHRTSPLHAPENSLAGIAVAAAHGADLVEVDVRLTRDGQAVLLHDHWPLRVARPRLPVAVKRLRGRTVTRLRIAGGDGERIPRFADAVAALPDGLGIAVDVKDGRSMAAAIGELEAAGRLDRAVLWSTHRDAVAVAAEQAPGVGRAWLHNTETEAAALQYLDDAVAAGATQVSVMDISLTPAVVAAGHERGLTVFSWVRTLGVQDQVIDAGPDGVVTDWVEEARRRIAEVGPR